MVSHDLLSTSSSFLVIACSEIGFLAGRYTNVSKPHLVPITLKSATCIVKASVLKELKRKNLGFDFLIGITSEDACTNVQLLRLSFHKTLLF